MTLRRACLVAGLALAGSGCEILQSEIQRALGADYDIPLQQEGPDMTVDVGEQVTKLEDEIFDKRNESDEARQNYEILVALCKTEPGKVCEPQARFPKLIPRYLWPYGCIVDGNDGVDAGPAGFTYISDPEECTMPLTCEKTDLTALTNGIDPQNPPAGNGCVDISDWLSQIEGLDEITQVAQAAKADLSEHGSLKNVKQVKKVTINRVIFHFKENSFTYAIPAMDAFVGPPVGEEEVKDAKALIADSKVTLFGTLSETAAKFTGEKDMSLNAEGKAKLSDALRSLKATVAAQANFEVPPETVAADADNCRDPAHLPTGASPCEGFPKPDGLVKLSVELAVTVTVNPQGK
ncbi:MAG: hypothetical protein AB2A00_41690 [Myxococcota bacterium]